MEIVIAILILFGAMVADSTPSTSDVGRTANNLVTDSGQATPTHRVEAALRPCRFRDGRLIQRDLTVPRASIAVISTVNSEEAGHGCVDR